MTEEKKMVWRDIPNPDTRYSVIESWFDFECDLDALIIKLISIRAKYPDNKMRVEKEYGRYEGDSDYLKIEYEEIESDSEFANRLAKESMERDHKENEDLKTYARLKKKFEVVK